MSRIAERFATLRRDGRKALIPYITAGDPQPTVTVPMMHALVEAGADIIELGVPFSDPMADGPTIQAACERALAHHVSLRDVLSMVRAFRSKDANTPVVLMGYLNPLEVMGYEAFAKAARDAGADGVLTVDLPPEEGAPLIDALRAQKLDAIFLLAPTTSEQRMGRICAAASGFVYYVSLKGVTGSSRLDPAQVATKVNTIRSQTSLPIGVGFGIKDAEAAARVAAVADAVVVGSAVVEKFACHARDPARIEKDVRALLQSMRRAMDERTAV